MEVPHFIFWEGLKAISLICLALLGAKIIVLMKFPGQSKRAETVIKVALVLVLLATAGWGARTLGYDTAAEMYYLTAFRNLQRGEIRLGYSNSLRAVNLRPGELLYWQLLERTKIEGHQFASALDDESALRALSGGQLDPSDAVRFATCRYFLGRYDQVVSMMHQMIQENRLYPVPYVLQGMSYIALKQYPEAEDTLLSMLGLFPTDVNGVAELAHAYYLAGDTPRAVAVLDATHHYSFPEQARERFAALKALYAQ
ncbi:MAG: tetratricopeptide repeat protein [Terriglobia bacterium]